MLPLDLIWGVDVAIKKLRPQANFQLEGTTFSIWNDPSGLPAPTWDEVTAQIEKDRLAAEEWENKYGSSNP